MNITKQDRLTDTVNKPVGRGVGGEARQGKGIKRYTTKYEIDTRIYIVQHRDYSQYFIINLNGIQSIKIFNHYVVYLKLTL